MEKGKPRAHAICQEMQASLRLDWSPWYDLDEDEVYSRVPTKAGVYMLRQKNGLPVRRLVGQSETLYVGRSGESADRTLRRRLLELVRCGPHVAWPRVRRLKEMQGVEIEFCCAVTDRPHEHEKLLLMAYEKHHLELPPFNRVGGLQAR